MTLVSSSTFQSLESAMAHPHGTEVDVVAVVAFVCPADCSFASTACRSRRRAKKVP
jgi:hypothetical protein